MGGEYGVQRGLVVTSLPSVSHNLQLKEKLAGRGRGGSGGGRLMIACG